MLQIANYHMLDCDYRPAADVGERFAAGDLRFIVLHYTAGASFSGAAATLTNDDDNYVSSHMLVGLDGQMQQFVPFDTIAWHAGKSTWGGYEGLNAYSIGIEMVNPGYARDGISYDGPTVRARHKAGGPERDWYLYPLVQIQRVAEICTALCRTYPTIETIIGHDDCSQNGKIDPGPAWDWELFRSMLGKSELELQFVAPDWHPELAAAALDFATLIRDLTPAGADRLAAIRKVREALWTAQASFVSTVKAK